MICISCKTEHNANFCPNCGENSEIKKISFKSTIKDAFSTITNMDKGFLYNLKMLLINPKSISIDYILGKRKGILNPISFLILSVTLYLIAENLLKIPNDDIKIHKTPKVYIGKVAYAAGKYVHIYFKYFWILSVIPLAVSTKLIFRRFNFIEHLVINSFILGQATIVGLLSYLVLKINLPVNPLVHLLILWLINQVFITKKNTLEFFMLSFTSLILFIIQLIIITIAIGILTA